jgi:hypothetical protein
MEKLFYKDPDAELDYSVDWSTWLASGESVSTYAVAVNSSLITISTYSITSAVVTAWLTGGNVGQTYTVSVKITTSLSRVDERSFKIKIKQR